jgi:arsenate reductase
MKIYHNPDCSKSCSALDVLKQHGISAEVVEYLHEVPGKDELRSLLEMLNMKPLELIRKHEGVFQQKFSGLDLTDDEWIDIMLQYPELIERPIVVKDGKAIIARPADKILELL